MSLDLVNKQNIQALAADNKALREELSKACKQLQELGKAIATLQQELQTVKSQQTVLFQRLVNPREGG